ncbi:MAG: hypothetical protein D6767_07470 [Candidatus Hydrogenedentota bacterium]|nr:MAG: hypothetical protein D6767_07470 [Candidatus Hydrogenedentota bacterium]
MIAEQIAKDALEARKARDSEKAAFLNTVLSDIRMKAKNDGNREPNDSDAISVLKKFLKSAKESLDALKTSGRDTSKIEQEIEILQQYLPKPLSEEELKKIIEEIVQALPEKNPKMMGKVMAALKEKYDGRYDGKTASTLARQALQG